MQLSVFIALCCILSVLHCCIAAVKDSEKAEVQDKPEQVWDYVGVRDDAFMFWWLYYTTNTAGFRNRPLVMWLQGGPGASSTGYGNFQELGPLDVNQNPRNTTWLKSVSLLFVDNPVGTGYSFVTNDAAYTTNSKQIADDLLVTLKTFFNKLPDFIHVPFYIFSESYGGKMTAVFSDRLYHAVQDGEIKCNFQGFAMGDSWISPVASIMTWGPYLYTNSLVDEDGLATVQKVAHKCNSAVINGNWEEATACWETLENTVESVTNGVNWYNILKWDEVDRLRKCKTGEKTDCQFERHVGALHESLADLMNGKIRDQLKIIPKNVTWGGQSGAVFDHLRGDFMKNVISNVSRMLQTPLKVVVYTGQLDLICDTMGTDIWVRQLSWDGLATFMVSPRKPWYSNSPSGQSMAGFVKQYKNFSFYWVLKAGHMVPADAGEAALKMLDMITSA